MHIRKVLFAGLIATWALAAAGATTSALTPEQVATLRAASSDPDSHSPVFLAGRNLAYSLAIRPSQDVNSRDVVTLVVDLRDPRLMESLKKGRYAISLYRDPRLESLALEVAQDASYDATEPARRTRQLLFDVVGADYQSSQLFAAVLAIQRRGLLARRAQPGGPPPVFITGPIGELNRYEVPELSAAIAELVPLWDDACEAILPASQQTSFTGSGRHSEAVPLADLIALYLRSNVSGKACAQRLARLLADQAARPATEALAERIHRLLALPVTPPRDDEIGETITLLGPLPADAQIDLAGLKAQVLAASLGDTLRLNAGPWLDDAMMKQRRARTYTPANLAYFTRAARYRVVADFLEHQVDVNPADKTWGTPLCRALYPTGLPGTRTEQRELVDRLIERGARVSEPEADGMTPLDYAAAFWDRDEVRLLVEHGADVKAQSGPNCVNATFAAGARQPDVVLYLLDHGADINARKCDGSTLLLLAVEERKYELAQRLIECGADVNLGSRDGITPRMFAHLRDEPKDREIAESLRQRGATLNRVTEATLRLKAKLMLWIMTGGGYP